MARQHQAGAQVGSDAPAHSRKNLCAAPPPKEHHALPVGNAMVASAAASQIPSAMERHQPSQLEEDEEEAVDEPEPEVTLAAQHCIRKSHSRLPVRTSTVIFTS